MLTITIPPVDLFDEKTEMITEVPEFTVELEHSLASISKWESKYEKPFLGDAARTKNEIIGYIDAMCLTPEVPPTIFHRLSTENFGEINRYINSKMTATWFSERQQQGRSREIVTSEVVYYWMVSMNIPFECEHWHFNTLLTLIKVTNSKNAPQKKNTRGSRDAAADRRALNEARRQKSGSHG